MRDRLEVYKEADAWRWHFVAGPSNKIMAESGESYSTHLSCLEAAEYVLGGYTAGVPRRMGDDGDVDWDNAGCVFVRGDGSIMWVMVNE